MWDRTWNDMTGCRSEVPGQTAVDPNSWVLIGNEMRTQAWRTVLNHLLSSSPKIESAILSHHFNPTHITEAINQRWTYSLQSPKLRNYLLWCIWRLFLKRTILDSQKGPCDMQLMQKAQEKVCCLEKFLFFKLIDRFSSPARFLRSPVSTSISAMYWSGKVRVTFWKGQAIGLYSGSSGYLMRQMGQGYQNQECLPLYFPSVLFPNVPIPFSHLMGLSVSFWH